MSVSSALAPASIGQATPQVSADPAQEITALHVMMAAGFLAVHIPLALVMRAFPVAATGHAVMTVLAALVFAAKTRRLRMIAIPVAYIAGSEVLWRMCKAGVFWELAKYSTIAILAIATLRVAQRRNRALAFAYIGLLAPSAALTVLALGVTLAREQLGFVLAGPVALGLAAAFFSNTRLTPRQLAATFTAVIGPAVGIAALAFLRMTGRELQFQNAGNSTASGGFGPNQVSAILGLAILFLLLLSFQRSFGWRLRAPMLVLALLMSMQSILTFSRGGIGLALAGGIAALLVLLRGNARTRITVLLIAGIATLTARYVLVPRLEEFTQGRLSQRYTNANSSGRDQFILTELTMFKDNPALGVGPGVGMLVRDDMGGIRGASHTEYTRMLAEHGMLGLIALVCLLMILVRAYRAPRDRNSRAIAAALVVWVALFLSIYATRLAAPAIVLGLAFAMGPPLPSRQSGSRVPVTP